MVSWLFVAEWDIPYSPVYCDHWYLSYSSMFLMTTTLACSGVPLSLMNILQLLVRVLWIFPCFFKLRAFLAMSELRFVRCSFMKTFVPFNFLPCFSSAVLCFLFANHMITAGVLLSFLRGRGWHASMLFKSTTIPFEATVWNQQPDFKRSKEGQRKAFLYSWLTLARI